MTDTGAISEISRQAPYLGAMLLMLSGFLYYLTRRDQAQEKRDLLFTEAMKQITDRLASMETVLLTHVTQSQANYSAIREADERIERRLRTHPKIGAVKK